MTLSPGPWCRRLAAASLALASLATHAGCTSSRPLLSQRGTTIGTLKTNLARVEKERDDARAHLAELEQESRELRDDLALEREVTGELTARLDDARALLADEGLASRLPSVRPARVSPAASDLDDDPIPPPRARRKAPFAQIGGIRVTPAPLDDELDVTDEGENLSLTPARRPRTSANINEEDIPSPARLDDDPGAGSRSGRGSDSPSSWPDPDFESSPPMRWLPVVD